MKFILPEQARIAIPFKGAVSMNNNGPAYHLYSTDKRFSQFQPFDHNYVVPILPGKHRGGKKGHYHHHKKEVFCLLNGQVDILLENVQTKEKEHLRLNGLSPKGFYLLGISTGISHLIINTGKEAANLLVYSNCQPDEKDEIAYDLLTE